MKASFYVVVWPILDPLFLVLVGTASGRLKIHLPVRHLPRNGLSSIAVFAMLCVHKSIWSYFFHHFAVPFLSGSKFARCDVVRSWSLGRDRSSHHRLTTFSLAHIFFSLDNAFPARIQ